MNRNLGISTRVAAGIALCLALLNSTSCFYFDPLNPFDRGLPNFYEPVAWEKYFLRTDYDYAIGYSVQQTADGGYIIAGYTGTYEEGSEHLLLIKTDALGNQEWSRPFGGEGQHRAHCVRQTADGGYIITGRTDPVGGTSGNDVWLIKTKADGTEQWPPKTFGGNADDEGWCVRSTTDGGYIIVGTTSSFGAGLQDVYLIKTDSDGNLQWSYPFGDSHSDRGYSVRQTSDGGYIIAGVTQPGDSGDDDAYLVKTDTDGNLQWSYPFGTPHDPDGGTCVQQTAGGYILVGYTRSYGAGDFDAWMIKTDSSGNKLWDETFGGTGPDRAESVQQTDDGGYIIAGMTKSFDAQEQAWLIKTDAGGDEEWSQTFGGAGNDRAQHVESVQHTDHGYHTTGFIVTGYTNSFVGGSKVYLIYYVPPLL